MKVEEEDIQRNYLKKRTRLDVKNIHLAIEW